MSVSFKKVPADRASISKWTTRKRTNGFWQPFSNAFVQILQMEWPLPAITMTSHAVSLECNRETKLLTTTPKPKRDQAPGKVVGLLFGDSGISKSNLPTNRIPARRKPVRELLVEVTFTGVVVWFLSLGPSIRPSQRHRVESVVCGCLLSFEPQNCGGGKTQLSKTLIPLFVKRKQRVKDNVCFVINELLVAVIAMYLAMPVLLSAWMCERQSSTAECFTKWCDYAMRKFCQEY